MNVQLVYSGDCPYCRVVAWVVGFLDVAGLVDRVTIESKKGTGLIYEWHGEYVHAPHLRVGQRLYWGVKPVAWRVAIALPLLFLGGLIVLVWRLMKTIAPKPKD